MVVSLESLLVQAARPRVLVLGDVMLDRYVWGEVDRISPEGPIPVLNVAKIDDRLGGAGNVAAMLSALDADASLASVVGNDLEGRLLLELLAESRIATDLVSTTVGRPSTVKERLLGRTQSRHPQQMIRVDRESHLPIGEAIAARLLEQLKARLPLTDLIMISDYGKGLCTDRMLGDVIGAARAAGVPVVVDPIRGVDYSRYAGCACITPNRTEASQALGRSIDSPSEGLAAAADLLAFGVESAAVTLDRDGMAWADARGNRRIFPVRAQEVCDITGAGDMVAAALSYALASGADWDTACRLANLAAGLEVERLGVVPLERKLLLAELNREAARPQADRSAKVVSLEGLQNELVRRRARGQKIAMTNGCFDLLHPGHIASLEFARREADCLVVGLNSDRSVRRLKGPDRPILDQHDRAAMLAALACVDYVVVFEETSVERLVGQILPDVLVKSADYALDEVAGREAVERRGGRVAIGPLTDGYSTSRLIERIQKSTSGDRAVA